MGACYNDESIACQQTNLGDQNNSKRFSSCPNYSISKRIEARQGTNSNTDNENKVCEGICAESQKWDKVESSVSIQVNNSTHLWYIILPSNKYLIIWDIWMMILLACVAFYIPYRVCLYWDENDSSDTASGIFMFELCTDVFFTLDIILIFFTAYQDGKTKKIITSPRMIALHYFRSSFFVDLVATIPFSYILSHPSLGLTTKLGKLGRLPKIVKFFRAVKLLKLLNIYKLQLFIMKLETDYNIHHGITRLMRILMMVLLVTHLVACFWYLVGITGGNDIYDGGWMYRFEFDTKPKKDKYIAALYWSFSTLTTVGYGDINARTPQEQIYAMLMMLLGVSWYGVYY